MNPLDLAGWDFGAQPDYRTPAVDIHHGDCLKVLAGIQANSLDSCVTDPPYHLLSIVKRFGSATAAPAQFGTDGAYARASKGFMGKVWDGGDVAMRPETWKAVARVLKPGAYMACFGGTRTFHRMACAIEDAGFEIRDTLMWMYGQGFPKSHKVAEMAGWGTALKPAWEPIILARKPLIGTVAANVLAYGTGGINIDGCRVEATSGDYDHTAILTLTRMARNSYAAAEQGAMKVTKAPPSPDGRWPANVIHDGSDEVLAAFPTVSSGKGTTRQQSGADRTGNRSSAFGAESRGAGDPMVSYGDTGSAARFFYTARGDEPPAELGRWPANVIHDGSDEVLTAFAAYGEKNGGHHPAARGAGGIGNDGHRGQAGLIERNADAGTASRFFYCAKAGKADRAGSSHPTVKPIALLRYLCRLITPPGGTILDPFAGSGTLGQAAREEGFTARLIEAEGEYIADIVRRMGAV